MSLEWDQTRFERDLDEYVSQYHHEVWPKLLNQRIFFVEQRAIPLMPKVEPSAVEAALAKEITAKRQDGSTGPAPLGFVLGAKKASKTWPSSKRFQKALIREQFGRPGTRIKEWRGEVGAQTGRIRGGRKAATGFMRLGDLNAMRLLGPYTNLSYFASSSLVGAKMRGRDKAVIQPATPEKLNVVAENIAHALSEKRGGFLSLGQPPMDRALQDEAAELEVHLGYAMQPSADEFNQKESR